MYTSHSQHAELRAQQRGVPPLIRDWLLDYGEEIYDQRGGVIRYFTRQSLRRIERDIGSVPLRRLSEYLRCYLVQSSNDGVVITVGKRFPNRRLRPAFLRTGRSRRSN